MSSARIRSRKKTSALNTEREDRSKEILGGMKQKISFAKIMLSRQESAPLMKQMKNNRDRKRKSSQTSRKRAASKSNFAEFLCKLSKF